MSASYVLSQHSGSLFRLCIQRPERRNALDLAGWSAIAAALDQARRSEASVLLLEGVPGAFCAGADIAELAELLAQPQRFAAHNTVIQDCQRQLERLPQTTIAAIDGVCVGGGLGLALCCDFRLATPASRFALTPARLGLVYSLADTRRLVASIGAPRARELLLSGETIDAQTAAGWGLVSELVDAEQLAERSAQLAAQLAQSSPRARADIKRIIAHVAGDPELGHAQAQALFEAAFASADFAEGAAAFLAKRPPRFGQPSR